MELNPSSAENVFADTSRAQLYVISSKQQRHCMVESTGYYEGGVGRVLSLSCILFGMVVFGNLMTFEIIELDYVS